MCRDMSGIYLSPTRLINRNISSGTSLMELGLVKVNLRITLFTVYNYNSLTV